MRLNKKTPLPGGDDGYLRPVDSRDVKGVYSNFPAYTPKYLSTNGRDYVRELTVARLYLSGGAYETLPGVAPWFSVNSYVGFFLQEVTERNAEKSQIIPMNGDGYAAFFSGREPRVYSFSGVVLNTQQDQWRSTLTNLYEEVFRGSKVSGMNRVVQIAYDDKVVSGSMMNMTQVISSAPDETFAKFAFDILVVAVYDAWMESDDDFTTAGSAFLGDKTIFPDMARSQTKKNLRDYIKSSYVALPPNVKPRGAAGVKCDVSKITVDAAGNRVKSENSSYGAVLPKECLEKDTGAKIQAEIAALRKKHGEDPSTWTDKAAIAKYQKLTAADVIIRKEVSARDEAKTYQASKTDHDNSMAFAVQLLQSKGSYSKEGAEALIKSGKADAFLKANHVPDEELLLLHYGPKKPAGNTYVPADVPASDAKVQGTKIVLKRE